MGALGVTLHRDASFMKGGEKMPKAFNLTKLRLLILTVLLMVVLGVNKAHGITTITPEFGNGPFADGRIGRNSIGVVITNDALVVGDDAGVPPFETIYRSFIGFDLSSLSSLRIASAILRLSSTQVDADVGSVPVDLVDFGNSLDDSDYDSPPLQANIGSFSAVQLGSQSLDVTDVVRSSLASGRVQFRLRAEVELFRPENNEVFFNDVEDSLGTGEIPELVVEFVPIPALTPLGTIAMALLLALYGIRRLRRTST